MICLLIVLSISFVAYIFFHHKTLLDKQFTLRRVGQQFYFNLKGKTVDLSPVRPVSSAELTCQCEALEIDLILRIN